MRKCIGRLSLIAVVATGLVAIPAAPSGAAVVAVSGVVRNASGSVLAGVNVQATGGGQTTTNASGTYSVQVLPGAVSLTFSWEYNFDNYYGPSYATGITNTFLAQQNVTKNLTLPTIAAVNTTVLDSNAAPVANARVEAPRSLAEVSGSLSDATPVSFTNGNGGCVTNTSGQCTFYTFLNLATPVTITSIGPTVDTTITPTTNPTNVSVGLAHLNSASLVSVGSAQGVVHVSSPVGTQLFDVASYSVAAASVPSGAALLTGALSYSVSGVAVGATIDVTLQLPAGSNPDAVYKLSGGSTVNVSSIATIVGDQITMHLQDGGLGDADGVANGVIVDPVLPVRAVAPQAPASVTAAPGITSATVSWPAPKSGGKPIDAYRVTPYRGNVALTTRVFASTTRSQTITGLARGTAYTFRVAAHNVRGWGATSGPSAPITTGTPVAPKKPLVGAGNGQAIVSWTKPIAANGSAIDAYRVTPYIGTTAQPVRQFGAPATAQIITGLTNGKTMTFKVQAHNATGWGPQSPATSAIAIGAPTTPTHLTTVAGASRVTLQWSAPSSDNGSPIRGYRVIPYLAGVAQWPRYVLEPGVRTKLITGLTSGAPYTFKVQAHNLRGWSFLSKPTLPVTPT